MKEGKFGLTTFTCNYYQGSKRAVITIDYLVKLHVSKCKDYAYYTVKISTQQDFFSLKQIMTTIN